MKLRSFASIAHSSTHIAAWSIKVMEEVKIGVPSSSNLFQPRFSFSQKMAPVLMGELYMGDYGISQEEATLYTIGVDPDYQHRGIAEQLINEFSISSLEWN